MIRIIDLLRHGLYTADFTDICKYIISSRISFFILRNWLVLLEIVQIKPPPQNKLRAGGEGDDRGWDGWMASLT